MTGAGLMTLRLPSGDVPFFDHSRVLNLVPPDAAIQAVREGFVRHVNGEWKMPPKVYLQEPPFGDFRAMPASGGGIAILKWVSSFPNNATNGVPTVSALVVVSDATSGRIVALLDGQAVTALRTGAAAAVATAVLAADGATTAGIIGCGLHGRWSALCLKAAGFQKGVCFDIDSRRAEEVAALVGWDTGTMADAVQCEVVTTITPGREPVIDAADLRPGVHVNALGADGPGKAELTASALAACELFCDEWEQASHGGEIRHAVEEGIVTRETVVELGRVLTESHAGRSSPEAITLFDSTGLAVQDLAVTKAVLDRSRIISPLSS